MGLVIGSAIEHLYNDELYKTPTTLVKELETRVRREFQLALGENFIDWGRSPPKEELLQTCLDGALGFLKTMKTNKLLGPYAKAELDITTFLDKYTPIGGRPDIIIRRDDTGVGIYDGKNAKTPGRYTNPDQLKWYALCFYLAYQVLPSKLAFVYFRYPEGTPPKDHDLTKPWTGLVEVPVTKDDLKELAVRIKKTYRAIENEQFDPTPSPTGCKYCPYETVCDARIAQKAANSRHKKSLPVVGSTEEMLETAMGIVEFGFQSSKPIEPTESTSGLVELDFSKP